MSPQTSGPEPVKRGRGRPKASEAGALGDPRAHLESVAVKIFAKRGYDAVSTGDVARAAGMTQSVVHYHFGSKEGLWRAAMIRLMHSLGEQFPNSATELKDLEPVMRLKVMMRRFILVSGHEPTLAQIILHESLAGGERLEWLISQYLRRGYGEFDEALRQGIESGLIKGLPLYALSNAMISVASCNFCFSGVVKTLYKVDMRARARVEEIADALIEMVFHGIVCPAPEGQR